MTLTRRHLALSLGAACAGATSVRAAESGPAPVVRGVRLGITTGSLNPLPDTPGKDRLDVLIGECRDLGLWGVELASGFFGPAVEGAAVGGQVPREVTPKYQASREAQRQWRLSPAAFERYAVVRDAFRRGGVRIFSMSNTFADDCTDAEIDAMFRQMRTLGVQVFHTNQTRVSMGTRLAPFARKYGIAPSFHNHAAVNEPDEVASLDSMQRVLAMSPQFRLCLDIGHFTAGDNDPVTFLREHHARITHIHVKDRKKGGGPNVAWGTGDTPIRPCLTLIRDQRWPIPCIVEREFAGTRSAFEETAADLDYMRDALRA